MFPFQVKATQKEVISEGMEMDLSESSVRADEGGSVPTQVEGESPESPVSPAREESGATVEEDVVVVIPLEEQVKNDKVQVRNDKVSYWMDRWAWDQDRDTDSTDGLTTQTQPPTSPYSITQSPYSGAGVDDAGSEGGDSASDVLESDHSHSDTTVDYTSADSVVEME